MKITAYDFVEGIHYRKLSDVERKASKWKYVLLRDVSVDVVSWPIRRETFYLNNFSGKTWGIMAPTRCVVTKGYAWDGSSCSPDRYALFESLWHDLFYQFSGLRAFPLTRYQCDLFFYSMRKNWIKAIYFLGVRLGGWAFYGRNPNGLWIDMV